MPEQEPGRITVVNVTFQGDEWDYDERVTLGGRDFRLVRVGTNGDAGPPRTTSGAGRSKPTPSLSAESARPAPPDTSTTPSTTSKRIKQTTQRVPVRDDSLLTDIFQEWAIRRVEAEMPGYFANARVVVIGGDHSRPHDRRPPRVHRQHHLRLPPVTTSCFPATSRPTRSPPPRPGIGEFAWRQMPGFDQGAGRRPVRLGQRQGRPLRR